MTRYGRLIVCLMLPLFLAGCQTIGGWFSTGSNAPEPAELAEITQTVEVSQLWSSNAGSGISRSRPAIEPVAEGAQIWLAGHRGDITAIDAESGRVAQRIDIDLPISAGPSLADGLIMVGTFEGELVVIDENSGTIRWRAQLSSEILAEPVLHDGVIVVRCIDGRVFGLDAANGSRRWVYDRSVPLLTLRGNSPPFVRAGQAYIGYDDGRVIALRVADGSVLWEQQVSVAEGRTELDRLADIDGPMVAVGSELYVVTYHGRLAGLALESGRILWVKDLASASGISLSRTQLAASDRDDSVWLIDRRNGATLWRDEQLLNRSLTRPVFVGNLLVTADFEGYLHFHDTDSGRIVARARGSRNAPATAPLVVGNRVYLLDEDGGLSAWRVGGSNQ